MQRTGLSNPHMATLYGVRIQCLCIHVSKHSYASKQINLFKKKENDLLISRAWGLGI